MKIERSVSIKVYDEQVPAPNILPLLLVGVGIALITGIAIAVRRKR